MTSHVPMEPRRSRRRGGTIALTSAGMLLLLGVVGVLSVLGFEGCGLGGVDAVTTMTVVDAVTGRPIGGAEVFVGSDFEVTDPAWRAEAREGRAFPASLDPQEGPWSFTRTDDEGRARVVGMTTHCQCVRRIDRLLGTVPPFLDGWAGVAIWVSAPGYVPTHRADVREPRVEMPPEGGSTRVVLDVGRVALRAAER